MLHDFTLYLLGICFSHLQDPHDELKNQNVLFVKESFEDTAVKFSLNPTEVREIVEKCRTLLYKERQKRPRPHLDDKIVAAWNGTHIILLLKVLVSSFFSVEKMRSSFMKCNAVGVFLSIFWKVG